MLSIGIIEPGEVDHYFERNGSLQNVSTKAITQFAGKGMNICSSQKKCLKQTCCQDVENHS